MKVIAYTEAQEKVIAVSCDAWADEEVTRRIAGSHGGSHNILPFRDNDVKTRFFFPFAFYPFGNQISIYILNLV